MLPNKAALMLEAARRRNAARHARERAKSIVRKDRRPDVLAAGRAHRAMLKLYARADAEYRACVLHPAVASIPAASDLGAKLRHAVDLVRELAYKCAGSPAADAMRLRMREDASIAMRLVRRIDALKRHAPPPPLIQAAPKLAPIAPPPLPPTRAPLYYAPGALEPGVARSEYYWEKHLRRLDGSIDAWQAQRKAARKQYLQSEKGKAAHAAATDRYLQSEKGKAARARYAQSDKGKAARAAAAKRYARSDKGKAARARAQAAYRARLSTAQVR
jgi:hypothetical protein